MECTNNFESLLKTECFKSYLAKVLGYLILLGSFALKLPQIVNIISTSKVDGLSPASFYGEVPLTITTVAYNVLKNNPFSSYGETCVILVQNIILVVLLWIYMKPSPTVVTVLSITTLFAFVALVSFNLSAEYQYLLPLVNVPIMVWTRIVQIVNNFKIKSTGQLSIITTTLMFVGFSH